MESLVLNKLSVSCHARSQRLCILCGEVGAMFPFLAGVASSWPFRKKQSGMWKTSEYWGHGSF